MKRLQSSTLKVIRTYLKNLNLPQTPAVLFMPTQIDMCHKTHFQKFKISKIFFFKKELY